MMLFLCSIVSLSLVMYSGNDAVSMFNCVPFTCNVFWWWCCFYVQLCPFHLWCILVMMLFLCSIVSLSFVKYSSDDAISMFNCVPFTCDVFWWWSCFYVQLCPFHLWCFLVMKLFLCSIVSLSRVMYSGDYAVSMFNCAPFNCDVFGWWWCFYVQLCPFHLWCILVIMLFLRSIVSLSLMMYSGGDPVSMFVCVPFTCDVFCWWCCFYVQLCPIHLWCILLIMLFLCLIMSLSLVMYSGDDAVSLFNCGPFTYDVFWWWCCFYVQLCPFHLWCILVMMLFLCSIVSLSLAMYSGDEGVPLFNCVPFSCDVFWRWWCFYVQLCPFHLWCILVIMMFLCLNMSLSLVMYSGDDAVSMFNCVPFTCDVFWWWCRFYVQLCPFHLWSTLVMMLFLCSIVCFHLWCILVMMLFLCSIVSLVMYSLCDVFCVMYGCCFYVQLCPFHLWCILVMMLLLCSIVSLSFVKYSSDDDAVLFLWCILVMKLCLCSIVSLVKYFMLFLCWIVTCVFWWWCCFYVQLCPFHMWCILVMMLFLCSIVSLPLVMYSGEDAVSMFNCVPFTCEVLWWWCCFYVQLCPIHLWCILVMMLFLCSIVSLSHVMYSCDDAVSIFNCVPSTCDVFYWLCCFYV